ncbi:TPA: P2 family phage major capsid protein [Escherichia coli]|nr:P2 family phage major capsid protein [Escherichia coli]
MNLVMSDITRNKLGCYMAQQASLNNIPVSALVSRFTVEPSVQQRFENAVKESTEFTKKINVFGVTDQKGEKILLDTTGPIARTNTSYDGTKRRNPNNVVDLKNRKYQCEQVNYDTFISYPQLDAWAAHPDFQSRVSTQIARQVALDRIMIGFNGTSHADESNFSTNKLLQDVNVGWLEHIRTDASERVMNDVTLTSRNMDNTVAHAGKYANADALVPVINGESVNLWRWRNAVYTATRALILERYRDADTTDKGDRRADALDIQTSDLWRDVSWAISDILCRPRIFAELC